MGEKFEIIDLFNLKLRVPSFFELMLLFITAVNLYLIFELKATTSSNVIHRYFLITIYLVYFIAQLIFCTLFKVLLNFSVKNTLLDNLYHDNETYSYFIYTLTVFLYLYSKKARGLGIRKNTNQKWKTLLLIPPKI